jgi:hypothetical protein
LTGAFTAGIGSRADAELYTRCVANSSDFEWDTEREENLVDFGGIYDVRLARRIIKGSPRPVMNRPTEGEWGEFFEDALDSTKLKEHVDWSKVDDSVPVIAVQEPGGGIIIDGHHRLKKRIDRGADTVPMVQLTMEETKLVRRPLG